MLAGSSPQTRGYVLASACMALITFAYRLVMFGPFENDHYMHFAWAQQFVRGALPTRDFVDPGYPLTIALSAAAQIVIARGMLGEFVLCVSMLSLAAGVTCWLACRLSGSIPLAVLTAALQVAIFPRLYNYPKIVVPVVAVAIAWMYLERPTRHRAAAMGVWLTLGFLFRHDFLLYLAVGNLAAFATVAQMTGDRLAVSHALTSMAGAAASAAPYLVALTASGLLSQHVADTLEFLRGDANQWRFEMPPVELSTLLDPANAVAALYYAAFVLPIWLLFKAARGFLSGGREPSLEDGKAFVIATTMVTFALGVIRHPIAPRLPDAAGLMPLVALLALPMQPLTPSKRFVTGSAMLLAVLAVLVHGEVRQRMTFLWNQSSIARRAVDVWSGLHGDVPGDALWPGPAVPPSVRYLRACTNDDDHVLVTSWAPQVFTFADRPFAAGHSYFLGRSYFSHDHQLRMLKRLRKEHVPVALVNPDVLKSRRFDLLEYYLNEEYIPVGEDRFGDEVIAVLVRRRERPARSYPESGWPCFR